MKLLKRRGTVPKKKQTGEKRFPPKNEDALGLSPRIVGGEEQRTTFYIYKKGAIRVVGATPGVGKKVELPHISKKKTQRQGESSELNTISNETQATYERKGKRLAFSQAK